MGIHAAVNRVSQGGQIVGASQKISVMEAVRLFTHNGAIASFEEHSKGSLEVGKLADLTVLSESITQCDPCRFNEIQVDMAVINGRIVHER
jgi:hypothetical protein